MNSYPSRNLLRFYSICSIYYAPIYNIYMFSATPFVSTISYHSRSISLHHTFFQLLPTQSQVVLSKSLTIHLDNQPFKTQTTPHCRILLNTSIASSYKPTPAQNYTDQNNPINPRTMSRKPSSETRYDTHTCTKINKICTTGSHLQILQLTTYLLRVSIKNLSLGLPNLHKTIKTRFSQFVQTSDPRNSPGHIPPAHAHDHRRISTYVPDFMHTKTKPSSKPTWSYFHIKPSFPQFHLYTLQFQIFLSTTNTPAQKYTD